jgi:hypothetical protein
MVALINLIKAMKENIRKVKMSEVITKCLHEAFVRLTISANLFLSYLLVNFIFVKKVENHNQEICFEYEFNVLLIVEKFYRIIDSYENGSM